MSDAEPVVTLTWRFDVPPKEVFRAWIDPEWLVRWLFPSRDVRMQIETFDPRPGGAYCYRFHTPDGGTDVVLGRFLAIEEPSRLIFTWSWAPPDPDAGIETQVRVDLAPDRRGTRLVLTHERLPSARRREEHRNGWTGALTHLGESLGGKTA